MDLDPSRYSAVDRRPVDLRSRWR